jgi:hypothetical protein
VKMGQENSVPFRPAPAFNRPFLNFQDKNRNGTLKTKYGIRNGLAIFCPFMRNPVFIR